MNSTNLWPLVLLVVVVVVAFAYYQQQETRRQQLANTPGARIGGGAGQLIGGIIDVALQ